MQPHAHYRAADVSGTATFPDGTTRTLIHIGHWDFRWQHVYRYTEPVRLPKGTTLAMRYVYDNSPANPRNPQVPPARVRWGQRSFDEMGDLWFQLATDSEADRARLRGEVQTKMTAEDLIGLETMLLSTPGDTELHDDAAVLALLLGRPAAAVAHFRVTAERRPDSAAAHYNLGTALTSAGLFDDADRQLRARAPAAAALSEGAEQPRRHAGLDGAARPGDRALRGVGRGGSGDGRDAQQPRCPPCGAAATTLGPSASCARPCGCGPATPRPTSTSAMSRCGPATRPPPAGMFRQAAAARPDWALAQTTAAWVLATAPDAEARAPADAVAFAERGVSLTGRRDAQALDVLAASLAAAGRFDEAVRVGREALGLAAPPLKDGHRRAAGAVRTRRGLRRSPLVPGAGTQVAGRQFPGR